MLYNDVMYNDVMYNDVMSEQTDAKIVGRTGSWSNGDVLDEKRCTLLYIEDLPPARRSIIY